MHLLIEKNAKNQNTNILSNASLKLVDHISSTTITQDMEQMIKHNLNFFYDQKNGTARSFNKTFFRK